MRANTISVICIISVKAKEKKYIYGGFLWHDTKQYPSPNNSLGSLYLDCYWRAYEYEGEGGNENPFPTSFFSFPLLPACTYPLDGGGGGKSNQQSPE